MPSLFLYLDDMGASASFYALVVASYSVGEAVGSLALGAATGGVGDAFALVVGGASVDAHDADA